LKSPERYEIQLGGGCGSMGSLSGRGSPDLFAVYKDRIYIFASYACRERFLKVAEDILERDDPAPDGSPEEARRGRALVDKAVQWAGGAKALGALNPLRTEFTEKVKSANTDHIHTVLTATDGLGRFVRTDKWNSDSWTDVTDGKQGAQISKLGSMVMHPQQIRELLRIRNKCLPWILRASSRSDFEAYGRGRVAKGLERVEFFFDGTWGALEIDPADGRISSMEFTAIRAKRGIERHEFIEFIELSGVRLPAAWVARFDGREVGRRAKDQTAYRSSSKGIDFSIPK
jgi:hypothetical protein